MTFSELVKKAEKGTVIAQAGIRGFYEEHLAVWYYASDCTVMVTYDRENAITAQIVGTPNVLTCS
jgi:hypothetical protein